MNQRFAELEAKMSGSLGEPSSLDAGMIESNPVRLTAMDAS